MAGSLYVVATPIGNLDDITFRAVEVLKEVDQVAAEDTRVTRKLFQRYDIHTPMVIYHDMNERNASEQLISTLLRGKDVALVTDAGTPLISDPGFLLIHRALNEGISVFPVPGPSAVTAALSVSGLPTDHFFFEGFLPRKKGRKTRLEFLSLLPVTIVIYESPYRVVKSLQDILDVFGDRSVTVCRELTKLYEEKISGRLNEILKQMSSTEKKLKGEFVIIVAKKDFEF